MQKGKKTMIKIIQNTEVLDPCDYDQGSYGYMRCEECIIKGCTRDTKRPFGTGRSCHDISIDECWESNCIDCSATVGGAR